jgi:hypothetical protein
VLYCDKFKDIYHYEDLVTEMSFFLIADFLKYHLPVFHFILQYLFRYYTHKFCMVFAGKILLIFVHIYLYYMYKYVNINVYLMYKIIFF